ncbi:MAG: type II secretion system protein [Lachnospirales bacterium]
MALKRKKAFSLIEIIAAVAILGIVSLGVFTLMGREVISLNKLDILTDVYETVNYDLKKATTYDDDIDGEVSLRYDGSTEINAYSKTANVNGIIIEYELFLTSKVLNDGEVLNFFTYNFDNED